MSLPLAAACADDAPAPRDELPFAPEYLGASAEALDAELVRIRVEMRGARDAIDLREYADCAVGGYAQARGLAFVRHLRTSVDRSAGVWAADAFYTMSAAIPDGVRTVEADVIVAQCAETGIPTV